MEHVGIDLGSQEIQVLYARRTVRSSANRVTDRLWGTRKGTLGWLFSPLRAEEAPRPASPAAGRWLEQRREPIRQVAAERRLAPPHRIHRTATPGLTNGKAVCPVRPQDEGMDAERRDNGNLRPEHDRQFRADGRGMRACSFVALLLLAGRSGRATVSRSRAAAASHGRPLPPVLRTAAVMTTGRRRSTGGNPSACGTLHGMAIEFTSSGAVAVNSPTQQARRITVGPGNLLPQARRCVIVSDFGFGPR